MFSDRISLAFKGQTLSLRMVAAAALMACAFQPASLGANSPRLVVTSNTDLRFGSFAVMDRGHRVISPGGAVQSSGIFSTGTADTGPARFTVAYDRGNNGRRKLDLEIEMVFGSAPVTTAGGVVARLSSYRSDLRDYPAIEAGQVVTVRLPNCVQRVCQTTFNLGARLDVDRDYGGTRVTLPIPVDVVLISVT